MEPPEIQLDAETGFPLLPAQRALAAIHYINDTTATLEKETLVLPNLILTFKHVNGVRIGYHLMCDPPYARRFAFEEVPPYAEHVTNCEECETHKDHSMVVLDPEVEFSAPNE